MPQESEQEMTPEELERWERLTRAIRKLAAWNGYDIGELIADGYLEEGDLND